MQSEIIQNPKICNKKLNQLKGLWHSPLPSDGAVHGVLDKQPRRQAQQQECCQFEQSPPFCHRSSPSWLVVLTERAFGLGQAATVRGFPFFQSGDGRRKSDAALKRPRFARSTPSGGYFNVFVIFAGCCAENNKVQ